jgi:putative transposase
VNIFLVKLKMQLNEYGEIVEKCWFDLPNHYKNCVLDAFIIMPNHIHGIVIIDNDNPVGNGFVGNGFKPFPTTEKIHGLSEIIRGFKTFSSKNINLKFGEKIFQWQKSFYDHIIRNEKSLFQICEYIQNNPLKWELEKDRNHLSNIDF